MVIPASMVVVKLREIIPLPLLVVVGVVATVVVVASCPPETGCALVTEGEMRLVAVMMAVRRALRRKCAWWF